MALKAITNLNDPNLVRAVAHPLRARILGILQERRASPRELSDELGAPLGNVSYHVRILAGMKLIRLVKKTPRRGAIEHHYEAVGTTEVSDEAWAATPPMVKNAMVASRLGDVARSVNEGAAAGGFDRAEAHLTRTRLTLDEKGWRQLAQLLMDVLERVERIEEQSAKRMSAGDGHPDEMQVALVMMLFETLASVSEHAEPIGDGQARPKRALSAK